MLTPILILSLLILLNGLFAMSELAMMTSRKSRLQASAKAGHAGAAAALTLANQPSRFLSTVQVGITLIGVLAGAFGENSLSGHIEPLLAQVPPLEPHADTLALILVVVAITYFSLVVGELIPKRIALAHPETMAALIAPPLLVLSKVSALPVKLLTLSTDAALRILRVRTPTRDDVSEEDVRSLMDRAASTGIFTPQELSLFQRTMRLGDLTVRDLMVPRADAVCIEESDPPARVRVLLGTNPYSHFPVCRGGIENVLGVVHIKDLIAHGLLAGNDFKITDIMKTPLYVPETLPALALLDNLKDSAVHIAFVVDEYGVTEGLLTLNDITRAVVGFENAHPHHPAPAMTKRPSGEWLADGRVPLIDLAEALGLPRTALDDAQGQSSAAGLVAALLGRIPSEGETLTWQGHTLEVLDMDGTRIDKILITSINESIDKEEDEPESNEPQIGQ